MATQLEDIPTDPGLIGKITTASWKDLNKTDGLELLGFLSYGTKWLGAAGGAVSATVDGIRTNEQFKREAEIAGVDPETIAAQSRVAEEALRENSTKVTDAVGNAAVSTGAGLAAAAGAVALLSNPVGWVAGAVGIGASIVGGFAGSKAYDVLLKSETKDTLGLIAKIRYAQASGITDIPQEAIAAALFSTMPEGVRRKIEDDLEKETGSRSFNEAVKKEKYAVLSKLMEKYDLDIRAQTGIMIDPNNPEKLAATQFAELINTRQLDARALIFDKDNLPVLEAMQQLQASGVTTAPSGAVQDLPPNGGSRGRI